MAKKKTTGANKKQKTGTSKKLTRKTYRVVPRTAPAIEEPIDAKKRRARRLLKKLDKLYPAAECALTHRSPYQLLVATILSAQSTDDTVNKVTPVLFKTYKTPQSLADAPRETVERIIHSTGFFRQKAKNIQGTARIITDDFAGKVPKTMDGLTSLPGVARKTANVVLGSGFGINEGIVVDTHIGRLATRLGLTWTSKNAKDAVKIERDLMEIFPQKEWTHIGHTLIWHGRKVCGARKPDCDHCTLSKLCSSAGTFD